MLAFRYQPQSLTMYISTYLLSVAAFQTIVLAIPAEHAWATEDPWNPDDPYTTAPPTTTTPTPPASTCPAAVTIGGSGSCANRNNDVSQCDSAAARACCRLTECSGYLINYDTMQWTLLSSKAGCDFYDAAKTLKTGNTMAVSKPDCATFPVPNTSTTMDDVPWALSASQPTATSSPVSSTPSASCNPVAIQSSSCRVSCYNEASSACCNNARCSAYLIDFQGSNYTLYSMASGCNSNALPIPRAGVVPFSKNFCQASTSAAITSLSTQVNETSDDREVSKAQVGSSLESDMNVTTAMDQNQYNVTTDGDDQDSYTSNSDETDVVLSQLYKTTAVSHNPLKPRAGDYAPTISSAEWNCKVLEAPKDTVVVTLFDMESSLYFKQFKAVLNATAYQNRIRDPKKWAFQFYSLDVKDEFSVNVVRDLGIQHLPTWVFWQDGQEASGVGGLSQKNNRAKSWDGFENLLNSYYKAFGIIPVSYKQVFPQGGPV